MVYKLDVASYRTSHTLRVHVKDYLNIFTKAVFHYWNEIVKSWHPNIQYVDLGEASAEEKVAICQKDFIFGFFLLPFFWLVNSLWFFKEAFLSKDAYPKIRRYVGGSMVGTVIWTATLIVWTVVYQTHIAIVQSGCLMLIHYSLCVYIILFS